MAVKQAEPTRGAITAVTLQLKGQGAIATEEQLSVALRRAGFTLVRPKARPRKVGA